MKRPSAVPTPFGFVFGDRDDVFITEANGGGVGATVSYRVDRDTGEVSPLVGRLDQGMATCWAVLNSDQTIGFSANTGSGTISSFKANFDGTIDFRNDAPIDMPEFTGNGVRDLALTQDLAAGLIALVAACGGGGDGAQSSVDSDAGVRAPDDYAGDSYDGGGDCHLVHEDSLQAVGAGLFVLAIEREAVYAQMAIDGAQLPFDDERLSKVTSTEVAGLSRCAE